jgi:hypothetical protein
MTVLPNDLDILPPPIKPWTSEIPPLAAGIDPALPF